MADISERHLTGHCERCGAEHLVPLPHRDPRDLELHNVAATFRYCSGCERYVGRSCCWRPDAVACADCTTTLPDLPPGTNGSSVPDDPAALGHMRQAVLELEQLAEALHDGRDRPLAGADWVDAWATAGLVDARIHSLRDAIAKRTWNPPESYRTAAAVLDSEVQSLLVSRDQVLARIQDQVGASRRQALRKVTPLRPRLSRMRVAGTVAAVTLLGIAIGGVAAGAWTRAIWNGASPAATGGGSAGTGTAASEPLAYVSPVVSPGRPVVSGEWTFDDLRMGLLESESGTTVGADAEIVAFPTAVDRSVALRPGRASGLCIGPQGYVSPQGALSVDLYGAGDLAEGTTLGIALAVSPDATRVLTLRLAELGDVDAEAWIRLRATWSDLPGVRVDAGLRDDGRSLHTTVATRVTEPVDAALCIWQQGDPTGSELLVDNVRLDE